MTRLNITILLLCAVLGVAQVWMSFMRNSTAREMHRAQQSIIVLNNEIKAMKIETGSLLRPERLRQVAHEQLGMRAPLPTQLLHTSGLRP
ncbi:MAG: cell division protein FtsL [Mariprofundaceae bacterium]|nr:cell division protein FtsL [Mariprofundaceae bacterium]